MLRQRKIGRNIAYCVAMEAFTRLAGGIPKSMKRKAFA
jgi:hypothetical protein